MNFRNLDIAGLVEVVPTRIEDPRGYFSETYRENELHEQASPVHFVQENESLSVACGTIRGLHFQVAPFAQGKLVKCLAGSVYDVAVDLRKGSATFGKWTSLTLASEVGNQLWIPPGFAHGFCTLEANSVLSYKVTAYYSAPSDRGLAWNDPELAIDWPSCAAPETISAKDKQLPALSKLPSHFDIES